MGISIPSNLIVWVFGSVVTAIFGIRAYLNYRKLNSPLSKYFAISSFAVSASWLLWILPFVIFDLDHAAGRRSAALLVCLGDVMLYCSMLTQVRIYWYLALQNTTKYINIAIPTFTVAAVGLVDTIYAGYASYDLPQIIDGEAVFPNASISRISQLILIVAVFFVGIELLKRAAKQKSKKSKLGSIAIALLHICLSLGGAINLVSTPGAVNTTPLVIGFYTAGLVIFTVIFLTFRLLEIHKRAG